MPAAATQTRVRVSTARQGIFTSDALLAATLFISWLGDQLRMWWLSHPEAVGVGSEGRRWGFTVRVGSGLLLGVINENMKIAQSSSKCHP